MKARTSIELSQLRTRLMDKNADYTKLFLMLSDNLHAADRETFCARAKSIPLTDEEANFLFDYLDTFSEGDGSIPKVDYSEFIKEMSPNDIELEV